MKKNITSGPEVEFIPYLDFRGLSPKEVYEDMVATMGR